MRRRLFLACASTLAAGAAAAADTFPVPGKPVRIVVPFPPGGQADLQVRAIAPKLADVLKVPVVVENKPGGASIPATMEVVKAPADGHTLLYTILNTYSQNPYLFSKLPYEPARDLTPVMVAAYTSLVLVAAPDAPFNTVAELVDYARRNPGKATFASLSAGSTSHLGMEMLKQKLGLDMLHVPFKGSADANMAIFGGHVQMMLDGPTTAIANARAGKVKLLAYADSRRLAVLPDVPTFEESGVPDFSLALGMQFFGPGNMAPETTRKVNAALATALRHPEVARLFVEGGNEVAATSAEEHARRARDWSERWGAVIRRLGLKLD